MSQVNNTTGLSKQRPQQWRSAFDIARYLTEIELFLKQVYENLTGINTTKSYTVATLPDAASFDPSTGRAAFVFVSDESDGATLAFSDGVNWRRVQDRVIVS